MPKNGSRTSTTWFPGSWFFNDAHGRVANDVANLSAKETKTKARARIQKAKSDPRRQTRAADAPKEASPARNGMIAKKFRLPADEFPIRQPAAARSEHFSLTISKNPLGHNRIAAIVGVKVDKHSVRRHFWKRRALDWAMCEPNMSADILIAAFPPLNKLSEEDARKEFKKLFSKIT